MNGWLPDITVHQEPRVESITRGTNSSAHRIHAGFNHESDSVCGHLKQLGNLLYSLVQEHLGSHSSGLPIGYSQRVTQLLESLVVQEILKETMDARICKPSLHMLH